MKRRNERKTEQENNSGSTSICEPNRIVSAHAENVLEQFIVQPDADQLLLCRITRQLAPAIVEQRDNCARRRCTTFLPGIGALYRAVRLVAVLHGGVGE
jgi:hypothetical protein